MVESCMNQEIAKTIVKRIEMDMQDKMKVCNSCSEFADKSEFKKDRRRPDGLGSICSACSAHQSKIRRSMKMSPERALEVSIKELYRISPPLTQKERQQWDVVNLSLKRLITKEQ